MANADNRFRDCIMSAFLYPYLCPPQTISMKLAIAPLLLLISILSFSQTDSVSLDPVTVTASFNAQPISRTGRNIISIPGDRFHKLPVHSIDELLKYIPGVEVQMRGPQGSQSDIVLRGGTFQQVLVVLDGVRLNDPNTGHFNSYIPIAPSEIERIEILKGASSAIYGSEAVGGVINIVSKSFAAKPLDKKETSAGFVAGEYNLFNANAGAHWQNELTSVSFGALTNNSNGQAQRGIRGYFHNTTLSISAKQIINPYLNVAFRASYDSRDFAAQNFYTTFASDTADEKVISKWLQVRISFNKGKHNASFDAGFKAVSDKFRFNPSSIANDNRSKLFQFLLKDQYRLNSFSSLVSGIQFQQRIIRSNDRGNHSLPQAALFLIWNQEIGNFSFSPAARIDYSEKRGTEFVPQINLSYNANKLQLRASAGKTIREADFTERFNNYSKLLVTGGSVGNPDLHAEQSFSYEAGLDYLIKDNLKISLTAFQRRQTDLIDWTPTPYADMPRKDNLSPTGTFALAKNISEVNTTGLELDLQFNKKFKGILLNANMGLLWLESKSDDATPSFYLSSHARFLTNFNVQLLTERFSLSATGIYKHRNTQKAAAINATIPSDYFAMNLRAGTFIYQKRIEVFVQVDNVLDAKGADLLGSYLPARWLMGGARFYLR